MSALLDMRKEDPFPRYDAEVERINAHLATLAEAGWNAASNCQGWRVRDVCAHLCGDEIYNQACLDGTLDTLNFSGGLDGWNARNVHARRKKPVQEVFTEWQRRQSDVRKRWATIGVEGRIETSVGRYPLRLQVWHLAQEYATHADDMHVPVPKESSATRALWRTSFGFFAAEEEGAELPAHFDRDRVVIDRASEHESVDLETFLAWLTARPQQLQDREKRELVERLMRP